MKECPKCGAMLLVTTTGETCQNCGWRSNGTAEWAPDNAVNLPLIISNESLGAHLLETDTEVLLNRVSALEADLEELKRSTRAKFENVVEQIGELRERCDRSKPMILPAEVHEKTKEDLLKALKESNAAPIIDLPKPIRYVYIIRERTREFTASSDWDIVGNVCYPTFKDANEKMKELIKYFRQLDPDYDANNLNIIQVKVKE